MVRVTFILAQIFTRKYEDRTERFGNGREVRNFFEETVTRQSLRLSAIGRRATKDELRTLLTEDICER
jgi:hypothetical protein